MPYTPPTQRSPASSITSSPSISRNASLHGQPVSPSANGPRPGLPRSLSSTSYLQKHRRSPSISKATASGSTENNTVKDRADHTSNSHSSIRQSPPPVIDGSMPSGALISPPDSAHESDDESSTPKSRGRHLDNLAELQEAVRRTIELRKEGSPPDGSQTSELLKGLALATPPPRRQRDDDVSPRTVKQPALSPEARKFSHSRSSSANVFQLNSAAAKATDSPVQESDDSEGDDGPKPPLLRKKSGELVKPALRRRFSSVPGTPTYSKAVHFNEDIEQVRHFLQVDRPIAVSAGASPVETFDSETEFPFGHGNSRAPHSAEWEIRQTNFPADSVARDSMPLKLERIFLSPDSKTLIGTVAVTNLAFQKLVVARFTLDYWKTTSEVVAEYNSDVRKLHAKDNRDRFSFNIKLSDLANLENKTLLLCVRYSVNGQQFWDNNSNMNFQVDFMKRSKHHGDGPPQKPGLRPLQAIPRSKHSPPATARPRSMPASLEDDFIGAFDTNYRFGSRVSLQDAPSTTIRFKSKPKDPRAATSNETAHGANAAFGTRYDFSASLSAALSNAQSVLGDDSDLKVKPTKSTTGHYFSEQTPSQPEPTSSAAPAVGEATSQRSPRLEALSSEKPPQDSAAYNELIQKYCFFGSNRVSSPQATPTTSHKSPTSASDSNKPVQPVGDDSAQKPGSNTSPPPAVDGASDRKSHAKASIPIMPRSGSPTPMTGSAMSSRAASPGPFVYPYRHGMNTEFHQPTAIHG